RPHHERPLAEIPQQRHRKSSPPEHTSDVPGADAAAAQFANVLTQTRAHQVVAGGKTTEQISEKGNPASQGPVGRTQLLNPQHDRLSGFGYKLIPDRIAANLAGFCPMETKIFMN